LQPTPADADEPQDRSLPSVFRANSSDDEHDLGGDAGGDDVCWPSTIQKRSESDRTRHFQARERKNSTYRKQWSAPLRVDNIKLPH
jgi:hypothetical protein